MAELVNKSGSKTAASQFMRLAKDEMMVSAFAHEAEHDLNKKDIAEIKGRYEGKGTHYKVDDFYTSSAYKISKQVFKEIP